MFSVKGSRVPVIERLWIGHNDRGLGSAWHLDRVELMQVSSGKRFVFIANRWLDKKQAPYETHCTLYPEGSAMAPVPPTRYRIT